MYKLFLDDIRYPPMAFPIVNDPRYKTESWIIVRDYTEFTSIILKRGMPSLISFDHDLDISHYEDTRPEGMPITGDTGYDCAKWLVEYCMDNGIDLPEYLVHSMNPVGKANIIGLFQSFNGRK